MSSNRRRNLTVHKQILELGTSLSTQHLEAVSGVPVPEDDRGSNGLGVQTLPSRDSNELGIRAARRLQAPLYESISERLGAAETKGDLSTLGREPVVGFTPGESATGAPFQVDPRSNGDALPPPEAFQRVEPHVMSQLPEFLPQHPTLEGRGQRREGQTIRISTPRLRLIRQVFRLIAQQLGGAAEHPTNTRIELPLQQR